MPYRVLKEGLTCPASEAEYKSATATEKRVGDFIEWLPPQVASGLMRRGYVEEVGDGEVRVQGRRVSTRQRS